jgi:L,D-transpeptidase YcbB
MSFLTPAAGMPAASPSRRRALARLLACLATPAAGLPAALAQTAPATLHSADPSPWIDAGGRATAAARAALALLATAGDDGLDPADYGVPALERAAARLATAASPPEATAFAAALADGLGRFLTEVQRGRIDPPRAGFRLPPWPAAATPATAAAQAASDPAAAAAAARPPLGPYAELRSRLPALRALPATPWPPLALSGPLKPGERHPEVPALRERLATLGDLPAATPVPADPAEFDGGLADGVRRFQARHGLVGDGVVGRSTRAALDVPPSRRVRQTELALERLRWLPPGLTQQRMVVVNIPMFRLWARDPGTAAAGQPAPSMAVIVGKAARTRTPVFADTMRFLIFQPYWNVPRSIVLGESLPAIARDPGYLQRQQMEIVDGPGDNARPVPASADNLAALRAGRLRLRQRPGPKNALGRVKFMFPNQDNIYLHDTPAPHLFARERRDFSHGCIRVEDPAGLAAWVLQDQPEWTAERIALAMTGPDGANRRVNLKTPVRVLLFYMTALALPGEALPRFADDLYGHDAALERLLAARRR